jgi:hypothetical protein
LMCCSSFLSAGAALRHLTIGRRRAQGGPKDIVVTALFGALLVFLWTTLFPTIEVVDQRTTGRSGIYLCSGSCGRRPARRPSPHGRGPVGTGRTATAGSAKRCGALG